MTDLIYSCANLLILLTLYQAGPQHGHSRFSLSFSVLAAKVVIGIGVISNDLAWNFWTVLLLSDILR